MFKEIAHRLGCGYGLENSMEALKGTIDHCNVHAFETDIQFSKDGVAFLLHDKLLNRTTNSSGYLYELTYKQIQNNVRLKNGEKVPTLDDLLTFLDGGKYQLYLELISFGKMELLLNAIEGSSLYKNKNLIISSFNHHDLKLVKEIKHHIPTMALLEGNPVNLSDVLKAASVDEVGFGFDSASESLTKVTKSLDIPAYAWTVNTLKEKSFAAKIGFDGVFTDTISPEEIK
ncbi:glycerophosphodiester phosphodiesterase [Alteromonas gilva]|uniref:Glycerophosphodiester phosphodiesterase n=1 Tax=Alteromonas gilva TaxID=2987522 RepID=A0ABT5L6L3_9ALTE|nr:glycerophosphodiester phosphodiesterase [Alteromonas gilva]MDC8832502.1 glycerophosphodiester phosphodiesterase [Alteromonas gilva]